MGGEVNVDHQRNDFGGVVGPSTHTVTHPEQEPNIMVVQRSHYVVEII